MLLHSRTSDAIRLAEKFVQAEFYTLPMQIPRVCFSRMLNTKLSVHRCGMKVVDHISRLFINLYIYLHCWAENKCINI